MGTSDALEVSPPAPLASTFLRQAANTPLAPRTPIPFKKVRREASLPITASNWLIWSSRCLDVRMMVRRAVMRKPLFPATAPLRVGTSPTMTTYWHPFADMSAVQAAGELSLARGEGSHVWDTEENRYLDATAGLWFANVGHGR